MPTIRSCYRIYSIRDGLLKQPLKSGYGGEDPLFDDCDSISEAEDLLVAEKYYGEIIILPITFVTKMKGLR